MKKEEIIRHVKEHATGTILSFPDRAPMGNAKYRGNFRAASLHQFCKVWVQVRVGDFRRRRNNLRFV